MLPDEALDSVFARGRESECILKHGTEKPLSNYDFVFIVSMQVPDGFVRFFDGFLLQQCGLTDHFLTTLSVLRSVWTARNGVPPSWKSSVQWQRSDLIFRNLPF
jgi:hypothetical protein